ncbi:MAG: hypothetical protein R3C02_26955, partial [Planctomycetaceae bacterium]
RLTSIGRTSELDMRCLIQSKEQQIRDLGDLDRRTSGLIPILRSSRMPHCDRKPAVVPTGRV